MASTTLSMASASTMAGSFKQQNAVRARAFGAAPVGRVAVSRCMVVRAAKDEGFSIEKVTDAWINRPGFLRPPATVTAATLPIVGISLLSKAITGHGLPGTFLGSIEGVAWLVLPLGFGELAPRLSEFVQAQDFTAESLMSALTKDTSAAQDVRPGDTTSARERMKLLNVNPKSEYGKQLLDLAEKEEAYAKETPEQREKRERIKAMLAKEAFQVGQDISDKDQENDQDELLSRPAVQTIADSMTVQNFDTDFSKVKDEDLDKGNMDLSNARRRVPYFQVSDEDLDKGNMDLSK